MIPCRRGIGALSRSSFRTWFDQIAIVESTSILQYISIHLNTLAFYSLVGFFYFVALFFSFLTSPSLAR
jgi:hypothetical protein